MMKHILLLWGAVCCCSSLNAQDYDQAFNHSVTDTVRHSIDTVKIGTSCTFVFETTTVYDTLASSDQPDYFQVLRIFDPSRGNLVQEISDSGHSQHEMEFVDFNSDGYKDLMVHEDSYNLLLPGNVWLFKPREKVFQYSEELSGMSELSVNMDGSITTHSLSLGGAGGGYSRFRFDHDSLVLVEDVNSDRFDYEKRILVDGKLDTVELDASDHAEKIETVTSKRMILGSLRVVKKRMIEDAYGMDLTAIDKEAILGEPFGTYIVLEQHDYEYKEARDGRLTVYERTKKLVNNRFQTSIRDYTE